MKISVVIPVYNGEKYIEKCLKSILGQTYKNIEVILGYFTALYMIIRVDIKFTCINLQKPL